MYKILVVFIPFDLFFLFVWGSGAVGVWEGARNVRLVIVGWDDVYFYLGI